MEENKVQELFDFIENSPTACHTVKSCEERLQAAGYQELRETKAWALTPGQGYYVKRGMTAIAAFRIPGKNFRSFLVVAPHGDSPCFKVKENPEIHVEGNYTKLNAEVYGGTHLNLWFDRPLSVAGRLMLRTPQGVRSVLVDLKRDVALIPSLAIHMNHEVNSGVKRNPQVDMLSLLGEEEADFIQLVAENAGACKADVLSHDLYLYHRMRGRVFGEKATFLAAPKLDDLECVFSALEAFLSSENREHVPVLCVFDNEEIGSMTRQGADSTLLQDVMQRVATACGKSGESFAAAVAGSFILSADNGHGVHPNYPEKSDPTNRCYLNGGVLVKNSPRYATDAISSAVFKRICELAEVPVQVYYNRSDVAGGSTLGNILDSHVSAHTVDIGLAQLAMHSPYESGGVRDLNYLVRAMQAFYSCSLVFEEDGSFSIAAETKEEQELSSGNQLSESQEDFWMDISSR